MKLKHAQAIVDEAYQHSLNVTLYENYSGRGMFGKTTAAVVGPSTRSCMPMDRPASLREGMR